MIAFSHIEEILAALTGSSREKATARFRQPVPVRAIADVDDSKSPRRHR